VSHQSDDRPTRTLAETLGAEPSDAYRAAWAALRECTTAELNYLRIDGIRAIQLTRVEDVESTPLKGT
jgi:hypothetical protein